MARVDPAGSLIMNKQGNLYGTTFVGGYYGCGTVFKLSPAEAETILHNFGGTSGGRNPAGGLHPDPEGNFYGVTIAGGMGAYYPGGVLYKITP